MKQLFNLKSYFTFLSRNKVYTAINVFGLSISLMFVIIIIGTIFCNRFTITF